MSFCTAQVILKPGRDKPVRRRHPWVFSGAVARVNGDPTDGEVVDLMASDGAWLARGIINRKSQIVVRLLTWNQNQGIDEAFWRFRLERAFQGRESLTKDTDTTAYRWVNAEGDGLPGLIVDRYGDWLVMQFLALGFERLKERIVRQVWNLSGARGIYERSDVDVRAKEGLPQVAGPLAGDEPPDLIEINENGLRFLVDVKRGHKTGFYLDQRDNRRKVAPYLCGGKVLNCFSYTGAFAVYAMAAGAKNVTNVDTSENALDLARRNAGLNESRFFHSDPRQRREEEPFCHDEQTLGSTQSDRRIEYLAGDVFAELRRFRAEGRNFDAVILDPPKFAQSDQQVKRAARGYQDINRVAMSILEPGGILATFSCSGLLSPDLFQKIIFSASVEAEREVQILEKLGQSTDHPILVTLPETEYLKGFVCRVW
ncbi:MAG: class I SAM-dependent rRNA methyltransferase [Candidatus Zixiibacteriota bacterium]